MGQNFREGSVLRLPTWAREDGSRAVRQRLGGQEGREPVLCQPVLERDGRRQEGVWGGHGWRRAEGERRQLRPRH